MTAFNNLDKIKDFLIQKTDNNNIMNYLNISPSCTFGK